MKQTIRGIREIITVITMATKTTVLFVVLSFSTAVSGISKTTCDATRPFPGDNVTCTCVTQNNIEWQRNDVAFSICTTTGICSPTPAGYGFQIDTSNPDKEYSVTVHNFDYSSCGVYSCTDLTTIEEKRENVSIVVFDSTSPSAIDEPGDHTSGNIQITTECLFAESDIIVEWFSVNGDDEETYSPKGRSFKTPTNCTNTCNGEPAVKLTIGFEHTEESTQIVKFKLKVFHKDDPSNAIELETKSNYKIGTKDCCQHNLAGIVVLATAIISIIIGVLVEYKYQFWGNMSLQKKIVSFAFLFGIGLFMFYRIRCFYKAIWYVEISVAKTDKPWSHGASFEGCFVTHVTPGGPADGKLKKGYRILSINGKSTTPQYKKDIQYQKDINTALANPPEVLELSIKRRDSKKTSTLKFVDKTSAGISIKKKGENIKVSFIEPQSAAANCQDVEVNDCILMINGVSTANLDVADIEKMLTFSYILKVTKDVTLIELDPDPQMSLGLETYSPDIVTEVTYHKQAEPVIDITRHRPANMIKKVTLNGPAARHGIKAEDTIVSINGNRTKGQSTQDMEKQLRSLGDSISLKIMKDAEEHVGCFKGLNRVHPGDV